MSTPCSSMSTAMGMIGRRPSAFMISRHALPLLVASRRSELLNSICRNEVRQQVLKFELMNKTWASSNYACCWIPDIRFDLLSASYWSRDVNLRVYLFTLSPSKVGRQLPLFWPDDISLAGQSPPLRRYNDQWMALPNWSQLGLLAARAQVIILAGHH